MRFDWNGRGDRSRLDDRNGRVDGSWLDNRNGQDDGSRLDDNFLFRLVDLFRSDSSATRTYATELPFFSNFRLMMVAAGLMMVAGFTAV